MRTAALWVATIAWCAACGSFGGSDGEPAPGDEGGADAATPDGDGVADAPVEAGRLDGPNAECPIGGGPEMRVVTLAGGRRICVDLTEVTSAQYAAFVGRAPNTVSLAPKVPSDCRSLTTYDLSPADKKGALPQDNVSFCSAAFYCAAQGKRLCGDATTGAPIVIGQSDPDPVTEWELACANGLVSSDLPWGSADPSTAAAAGCNVSAADAGAPREVGAKATCGPANNAGPYDMIGNVWEWVSLRRDEKGSSYTALRGVAFDGMPEQGCSTRHAIDALPGDYATGRPDVGFRCCADPRP